MQGKAVSKASIWTSSYPPSFTINHLSLVSPREPFAQLPLCFLLPFAKMSQWYLILHLGPGLRAGTLAVLRGLAGPEAPQVQSA